MNNIFNILDYGAIADGKTDSTKAIQNALDDAKEVQGEVYIPSGIYCSDQLKIYPHIKISGVNTRSYRSNGGSVIKLNNSNAQCLIDVTDAYGCQIYNLCLDGDYVGNNIKGIALMRSEDVILKEEDTFVFDNVKVSNFTGDGIFLQRVWCFSIRSCFIYKNKGNGLYLKGWDGFIIDNWFSYNDGAGVYSDCEISAVLFNANRVEWNKIAGFKLINPIGINIVGNAFDASGGPAIDLKNDKGCRSINMTITGNTFNRSGLICNRNELSGEECHLHIERAMNVVVSSNSFYEGNDDCGNRQYMSPKTAVIVKKLKDCIIKDNVMMNCATTNVLLDYGEHEGNNNVIECKGSVKEKVTEWLFPFFED